MRDKRGTVVWKVKNRVSFWWGSNLNFFTHNTCRYRHFIGALKARRQGYFHYTRRIVLDYFDLNYRGYCSAMSCKILKKQPFGCGSPYQRLHMNSCKYSCRKLLLVFPFIFLNFSFAALQLLSACCVWTPVAGSTKLTEWFTVSWCKPRFLWILL